MGIKYLNKYLREHCTNKSIRKLSLRHLRGKKIVIDTSIYLYRFKEEHALFENMFLLMSLFKHYEVIPLFVFDGKPPEEKKQLLLERVAKKKEAQQKMTDLKETMEATSTSMTHEEKVQTLKQIEELERQCTRITNKDIEQIQQLMTLYNVSFVVAPEEADQLCAYLVNNDYAWACMSDDMDMFLYGCKRVLRHTSVLHHDVLLYDINEVYSELKMNKENMTELLLLMGTDYILDVNSTKMESFEQVVEWYTNYRKANPLVTIYEWFVEQSYISIHDKQVLLDTQKIINHQYDSIQIWWDIYKNNDLWYSSNIENTTLVGDTIALKQFLTEKDGFVFAC
jgi:hypothetical protein